MKRIPLKGGGAALVSDEDYARLSQYEWSNVDGYAARFVNNGGKARTIYMHRDVLGGSQTAGEVDHRDGNRLNNQRTNLRRTDRRGNATNMGAKAYPRGRYGRMVRKHKGNRAKPFSVQGWNHGKIVHGGYYRTPAEARRAAAKLRRKLGYLD